MDQAAHQSGNSTVLALVPGRGGSKGIPRKNIRPLGGKPLIAWSIEAALACPLISRCIVSTDDAEIAETAKLFGAEVPFLRPAELAGDESPATDYVRHCLDWLSEHGQLPDIVAILQPTSPQRTSEHLQAGISLLLDNPEADAVVSVAPVPGHFHPQWQFTLDQNSQLCAPGGGPPCFVARRQDLAQTWVRDGVLFVFRSACFEKHGSIYGRICLAVNLECPTLDIDTEHDWLAAERLFNAPG